VGVLACRFSKISSLLFNLHTVRRLHAAFYTAIRLLLMPDFDDPSRGWKSALRPLQISQMWFNADFSAAWLQNSDP
jgi:hypothetical protein